VSVFNGREFGRRLIFLFGQLLDERHNLFVFLIVGFDEYAVVEVVDGG
jgi:hypothetical protein